MFTGYRSAARNWLIGSLVTINLFAASWAWAETSVHKVKMQLHRVEHASGVVLSQAEQLIEVGLANVTVEVDVSLRDEEECVAVPPGHRPGPIPAPAHHPAPSAKPSRTTHPAK